MNDLSSKTFDLFPTSAFDEGGIETHRHFCYSRQYNKYKPDKFCIDLFLLYNSTHYFVRHIDIYQVNNAVNIDIHARSSNVQTTIKAVVNRIIAAGVGNDPDGTRKLF